MWPVLRALCETSTSVVVIPGVSTPGNDSVPRPLTPPPAVVMGAGGFASLAPVSHGIQIGRPPTAT
jgi:hypothetical protein